MSKFLHDDDDAAADDDVKAMFSLKTAELTNEAHQVEQVVDVKRWHSTPICK